MSTDVATLDPPIATSGPERDLRALVLTAFRSAISDARTALGEPGTDAAVHGCRKALRRARAIVRLVAAALPADVRRDVVRGLRDARRLLATSRDAAVLPTALATTTIDAEVRTAASALVALTRVDAPDGGESRKLVANAVAYVSPLASTLAVALPAELDWGDLAGGIGRTYRKARRALRRAPRSRAGLHEVRQRTKELTLQLEALAGHPDGEVDTLRKPFARLGDHLSDAADIIMLRAVIDGAASRHAPDQRLPVLDAIDADLEPRIRAGRRPAKRVFERRTRRFVRKLGKALRRDQSFESPRVSIRA